jgi:hypothetical protein
MYPNFDEILEELSYKVGIVDLTNESHKQILVKLLRERGIDSAQMLADRASVVFQYINEVLVKSKSSGNIYPVKKFNPDTQVKPTDSELEKSKTNVGVSDDEKNTEPTQTTAEPKSDSKKRIINGKDKTLNAESPLKTQEYQKELEPNDDDFAVKNQKFANPIPPPPYTLPDSVSENPKFPKRYVELFQRFMNTQHTGAAKALSHFSNFQGGQGKLPAQAGELMTMMGATMNDEQFKEFQTSVSAHIGELKKLPDGKFKKDGTRIVNEKWLKAAADNRKAILKKVQKQFPGYNVAATSWDTKTEVEALGMSSYDNKGYSTDIYLRLENEKGEPLLEEISLKQNLKVNLLNSGTGKFFKWLGADNVPDNINHRMFAKTEREKLSKFCEANADAIRQLGDDAELKAAMEEKGMDFDTALSLALKGKGSQRDILKVLYTGVKALEKRGNGDAKNLIADMDNDHANYVSESIKAVVTNPKLKEGMLNEIKNEFPLKSVADNEESVVLGQYMLDKNTMESIFGTSDFNEFKEGLISEPGPPPFIAYKVKLGGRVIPIANIDIREDGRNYGGQFKFEMVVNDEFAKEIIKANREVYG